MINLKFFCVLLLCSCSIPASQPPAATPTALAPASPRPLYLTAREAYDQALPLIAAWQAEARLFHVAVRWPSPGGRSPDWQLYFVDSQGQLRVVQNGQRLNVLTPPADPGTTLADCWLDSDEVLLRLQDLSQSRQAIYSMALHGDGHWELFQGEQRWTLSACSGLLASKPDSDLP